MLGPQRFDMGTEGDEKADMLYITPDRAVGHPVLRSFASNDESLRFALAAAGPGNLRPPRHTPVRADLGAHPGAGEIPACGRHPNHAHGSPAVASYDFAERPGDSVCHLAPALHG